MFELFIRYFSITFCTYYAYSRVLLLKSNSIYTQLFIYICMTLNSFLGFYLSGTSVILSMLTIFCLSYVSLTVIYKINYHISFISIGISYGISLICFTIAGTITCFIFLFIYDTANNIPYNLTHIVTAIFQVAINHFLFQSKRFNHGITALIRERRIFIGIFTSFLFVGYISIASTQTKDTDLLTQILVIFSLLAFSIFLLYYWRHRIKQTYIENLRRLERLSYENTIAAKEKRIKELEDDNAHLGQIIHKYRKVIPAMELSVMELLQNDAALDNATLHNKATSLHAQLEELRMERNNLLDRYQKDTTITPQSGLHTIDAMIALMEKRAKQEWIRYKTQIDPAVKELVPESVKEADLLLLLGDLIENAIYAVSDTEPKEIFIHLGKLNDCLLLEVSDSGIAFDVQTYQHFCNEPYTSHKENGGSGTGLMDIWKLKKQYKISLYIYEYETGSNVYTKKISFLFDRKNHFLLKTYRDKEVKNTLIRGDLHVFLDKTD